MAQIPEDVRQGVADAAEQYVTAYAQKAEITGQQSLFSDAIDEYETEFDGANNQINNVRNYSNTARNLYGTATNETDAYDAQMTAAEAVLVPFFTAFNDPTNTTIDFPDLNKRLGYNGTALTVGNIN